MYCWKLELIWEKNLYVTWFPVRLFWCLFNKVTSLWAVHCVYPLGNRLLISDINYIVTFGTKELFVIGKYTCSQMWSPSYNLMVDSGNNIFHGCHFSSNDLVSIYCISWREKRIFLFFSISPTSLFVQLPFIVFLGEKKIPFFFLDFSGKFVCTTSLAFALVEARFNNGRRASIYRISNL